MSEANRQGFEFSSPVILNFEHLFEPHAFGNAEPRYEADLEVPGDSPDIAAMKAAAASVAKAQWPGRPLTEIKFPWTLGDKLADAAKAKNPDKEAYHREHTRGRLVLKVRSKFAPKLGVLTGGTLTDYLGEKRPLARPSFYNGVRVYASVVFNAYEGVGANPDGVNAFLEMLVSTGSGDRLSGGGGRTPSEVFKQHVGRHVDYDPTGQPSDLAAF
jgi:hypothetical protein